MSTEGEENNILDGDCNDRNIRCRDYRKLNVLDVDVQHWMKLRMS